MIHSAIDGFSRVVPYFRIHTNNLAKTALFDFLGCLEQFHIPSRVRADGGGEFVHIEDFMHYANGNDRGSFITGSSVHNQRIERLWRDVFTQVVHKYYRLFSHMEDSNLLDRQNPVHISCLHYVFLPRIQRDMDLWRDGHNHRKVRTENNRTPMQMWV